MAAPLTNILQNKHKCFMSNRKLRISWEKQHDEAFQA